jgi:PKD repeat protein
MVEFALVLPVLLLILLLSIDFGRVFLGWVTLNNAARIAANYAASFSAGGPGLTTAQLTDYRTLVVNETNGIDCAMPSPSLIPPPSYNPSPPMVGGQATVNLSCRFDFITPLIGDMFPGGLQVGASSDFPIRSGVLANIVPGAPPTTLPPNQDFAFSNATGQVSTISGPAPLTVNVSLLAQLGGAAQTWLWTFESNCPQPAGTTAGTIAVVGGVDPVTGAACQNITPTPPAFTYTSPGTYTVTLTETNTAGTSPTYSHSVVVTSAALVASFYGTVPSPCLTQYGPNSEACGGDPTNGGSSYIYYTWPMTVNFTDTSNTTGASYSWSFGDGGTSTLENPSHTYSNPGSYTVSLTVTNSSGTNTATRAAYVNAGCVVPSFTGVVTSNGNGPTTPDGLWTGAHFQSGNLYFWQTGGTYSTNNPSPSYTINQQNPQGGAFFVATQTNGNNYACTTTGRVAPTGANPAP